MASRAGIIWRYCPKDPACEEASKNNGKTWYVLYNVFVSFFLRGTQISWISARNAQTICFLSQMNSNHKKDEQVVFFCFSQICNQSSSMRQHPMSTPGCLVLESCHCKPLRKLNTRSWSGITRLWGDNLLARKCIFWILNYIVSLFVPFWIIF